MPSYRCIRRTPAVALVGGIACASLLGMTPMAAATVTATSCSGSIAGEMGERIDLKSKSVKQYVVNAVHGGPEAPLLGWKNEQTRMREAFEEGKFEPIVLPKVPRSASTRLTGAEIATAVLAKIDSVDEVSDIAQDEENRKNIRAAVGDNCGLTVTATNYSQPTSAQPRTGADPAEQGTEQGTTRQTSVPRPSGQAAPAPSVRYGTGDVRAPYRYHTQAPAVPYASGERGLPSTVEPPALPGDAGQADRNVDNAGNAAAIEAQRKAAEVRLPLLLAVVALACVAAALVRTWVLRKVV